MAEERSPQGRPSGRFAVRRANRERASQGRKRLTIVLPDKSVDRLNTLVETTEAASYTEVLKNALRLYEALVEETEKGHEVLVKESDGRLKSYKIFV